VKYSDRENVEEYKTKFLKYAEKYIEIEKNEIVKLPQDFKLLSLIKHSSDPDVKKCISYLTNRGITEKEMWRFKLGYSEISEYRGRVIVPSFDNEGKLNYLVARKISDSVFGPKYINPKVKSSEIIFNELTINWKKELTLVEGAFDLIKVNENATCLLGSEVNESGKLFNKILENNTPILLCLDNDMKLKSLDIIKKFESYGIQISAVDLGSYKDPGELPINKFDEIKNNKINSSWENRLFEKINNIKSSSLGM
jgi:DNA primase